MPAEKEACDKEVKQSAIDYDISSTRRQTLRSAATLFGGSVLGSRVVVADDTSNNSYIGKQLFFEVKLEHITESISANSCLSGDARYYIDNESLYIGDIPVTIDQEYKALITNGFEMFTPPAKIFTGSTHYIPIKTGYMQISPQMLKVAEEYTLPTVSVEMQNNHAVLYINGEQFEIPVNEEKLVELDEVEVLVPTYNNKEETKNTRGIGPDTITVWEETEPEKHTIKPVVGLRNRGVIDVFGIEDGIVLPSSVIDNIGDE